MIILFRGLHVQSSYFAKKKFWLEGVAQFVIGLKKYFWLEGLAQFVIGMAQEYKNIFG